MKPEDRLKLEEKAVGTMDLNEAEKKGEAAKSLEVPEELPILPIREAVLYPKMILPIMVVQDRLIKLIDAALLANKMIGIVAVKNKDAEEAKPEDLFEVGCAAYILKMLKMPNNSLWLLIQGTARIRLTEYTQREPFLRANVLPFELHVEFGMDRSCSNPVLPEGLGMCDYPGRLFGVHRGEESHVEVGTQFAVQAKVA